MTEMCMLKEHALNYCLKLIEVSVGVDSVRSLK